MVRVSHHGKTAILVPMFRFSLAQRLIMLRPNSCSSRLRTLRTTFLPVILCSLLVLALVPRVHGQNSDDGDAAKPSPGTKIDGIFESPKAVELKAGTEEFKSLVVKRILPHGTEVEQGRNVIWFKTDDIDKRIRDAETERRLAEVSLREAEFKYEQFLESQKLDREQAERSRRRAVQDYDNFVQTDRDQQLKTAEFNLKNSQAALENAKEELEQLEKMYRQDELTEESEEIVLKRARLAVENTRFRLEGTEIQTARTIEQTVPRAEVDQQEKLERAELSHESSRRELEFAQKRRELELEQERTKFADQETKLQDLRDERKRLVIAAPVAGIVLHGALTRGALAEKPSTLDVDSSVTADQVLVTLVPDKPLQVRLAVSESQLRHLKVGDIVRVIPNAFPDQPLDATVRSISSVPFAGNKFDCVLSVKLGKLAEQIVPTMGCKVEFQGSPSGEEQSKSDES